MIKLIKIYFINTFKLSSLTKGTNRTKAWGFLLLMVFVAISMLTAAGGYSYFLGSSLMKVGAVEILPAFFMTMACILTLISVIYAAKGILFAFKDFDIQMSLPVSTRKIVASRIAILYIYELFYSLIIMLPALIVYAILVKPAPAFYPIALITFFFIPVIPVVIGVVIGTLISYASAKFRKGNAVKLIFMLLVTLAIMVVSFGMQNISTRTAEIVRDIMQSLYRRYPPVLLYTNALAGDLTNALCFVAVSLALFMFFSFMIGKLFKKMNTSISAIYTRRDYKLTGIRESGILRALYFKEIKAYYSSVLYVLNTAFGMILLLIASVALIVLGQDGMLRILKIPLQMSQLASLAPMAIAFIVGMSSTTAVSISFEGSRLWFLKVLPVTPAQIFISKICVNLTITVPVTLISSLLLSLVIQPDALTVFFIFVIPIIYSLFISVLGLVVNLYVPKLNWKNETEVIKQSSSVLITMLTGFAAAGLPFYFLMTAPDSISVLAVSAISVFAATALLMLYLMRSGGKKLRALAL